LYRNFAQWYNFTNNARAHLVDIDEIPEFPSWIILPLLFGITSFVIVIKKRLFHSTAQEP
jgi:hypothetical protein